MAQGGHIHYEANHDGSRPRAPFDPHHHEHHHIPERGANLAFTVAAVLNLGFVAAEAAAGIVGNSVALLADAGHNLGDVLGLLLAWAATLLMQRRPSHRFTYGLGSSTILAALLNAIILFITVGGIAVEAVRRLVEPAPVASLLMMAVAGIGILINGVTAWLFAGARHRADLNLRAVFLHMASDAVISGAVVVVGGVIYVTGLSWLDPASSLAVAIFIVVGSWRLLRDSVGMAMQGVPSGIETGRVRDCLAETSGVAAVHDLHIWPMSTTETALTCHLVMPGGHPGDAVLSELSRTLHERFAIDHVTVQIETGDPAHPCELVPDHVV